MQPLIVLLVGSVTAAAPAFPAQAVVKPCNASDPMQQWQYRPLPAQASLQLKSLSAGDTGPCLNVAKFGKAAGSDVWVSVCHEEHPWKANDGWTLDSSTGTLLNTRSKLCATESQQSAATVFRQATRHTVLGPCDSAQHWTLDPATGLLKNKELGGCMTAGGPPPPPGPGREPSPPFPLPLPAPSTVKSTLVLGDRVVARSGGPRYASFNFDWHCGASDAVEYKCRAEPGCVVPKAMRRIILCCGRRPLTPPPPPPPDART